jgi:hypothetical protein
MSASRGKRLNIIVAQGHPAPRSAAAASLLLFRTLGLVTPALPISPWLPPPPSAECTRLIEDALGAVAGKWPLQLLRNPEECFRMSSQICFYPAKQSAYLPFMVQLIGNSAEIRRSELWWFASYLNRTWVLAPQARIEAFPGIAHLHGCFIPHKAVRPHSEDLRLAFWLEIKAGLIVGTLVCKPPTCSRQSPIHPCYMGFSHWTPPAIVPYGRLANVYPDWTGGAYQRA